MQLYLPCCKHTATHISCAYMIPVDSGINCDSLQRAAADIVAICIWLLYELQLHKRCGRRGRNGGFNTMSKGTTETPRPNARTSSFLASSRELVSKFELTTRKLRSLGGCHNRRAERNAERGGAPRSSARRTACCLTRCRSRDVLHARQKFYDGRDGRSSLRARGACVLSLEGEPGVWRRGRKG